MLVLGRGNGSESEGQAPSKRNIHNPDALREPAGPQVQLLAGPQTQQQLTSTTQ